MRTWIIYINQLSQYQVQFATWMPIKKFTTARRKKKRRDSLQNSFSAYPRIERMYFWKKKKMRNFVKHETLLITSTKSTLESVSKEKKAFKLLKIKNQCTTWEKKVKEPIQLPRLQRENIAGYGKSVNVCPNIVHTCFQSLPSSFK